VIRKMTLSDSHDARRAFVAFAGGGAKGIIHVGALKALEEKHVQFRGLAGTSAGAIVACLKAAGFRADELIAPDSKSSIIDLLREVDPRIRKATSLFGRWGWLRIWMFRSALKSKLLANRLTLVMLWLLLLAAAVCAEALRTSITAVGVITVWMIIGAAVWCAARYVIVGLADASRFRDVLATLLQQKMFPGEPGRIVKMGDFGGDRPSLKIVSANLSRGRLHLFSPERTPLISTADAVTASMCLPIVFSPWKIEGEFYVDGGIVSNLPAWPFDEERELDPEALTIAIEIAGTASERALTATNWLPAAINTALFGSGELNLRAVGEAERILLETNLELLEFDTSLRAAAQEVQDAATAVSAQLDKRLFQRPAIYRRACRVTQELVIDVLESIDIPNPKVRVAVGVRETDHFKSLHLRYSVGYETHHDEGMVIPIEGSVLGTAWKSQMAQFELVPLPSDLQMPGPQNRLRRKLFWSELRWILCVPVQDSEGKIRVVVQVDGNSALADNPTVADAMANIEEAVSETFGLLLQQLAALEDDDVI
jgi:NTE family protein